MGQRFYTHYNRPEKVPEKNSGKNEVDRVGYISAQQRIQNLIDAGARLVASRAEQYDFPDGQIDEDFVDPTRSPNFDLADGTAYQQQLDQLVKNAQKKEIVQKKEDVLQTPEVPAE